MKYAELAQNGNLLTRISDIQEVNSKQTKVSFSLRSMTLLDLEIHLLV